MCWSECQWDRWRSQFSRCDVADDIASIYDLFGTDLFVTKFVNAKKEKQLKGSKECTMHSQLKRLQDARLGISASFENADSEAQARWGIVPESGQHSNWFSQHHQSHDHSSICLLRHREMQIQIWQTCFDSRLCCHCCNL